MQKDGGELCIYPPICCFHNLKKFFTSKKSSWSLVNIHSGDERSVPFFFLKINLICVVQDQLHLSYTKYFLSPRHPWKELMVPSTCWRKNPRLSLLTCSWTPSLYRGENQDLSTTSHLEFLWPKYRIHSLFKSFWTTNNDLIWIPGMKLILNFTPFSFSIVFKCILLMSDYKDRKGVTLPNKTEKFTFKWESSIYALCTSA